MKFPYKSFTEKELARMENGYYCILMGGDHAMHGEFVTFTSKEANKVYNGILNDLIKLSQEGSPKDAKYAVDLIGSLRIIPFRLH
jgi:hypothetical protein